MAGAARLPLHRGLCARRLLQPAEHPGAGPQGDARQPHQPDPVLHRGGGHPPHAGVHPLHRPHVHPGPAHQDQGGEGRYQLKLKRRRPLQGLIQPKTLKTSQRFIYSSSISAAGQCLLCTL